MLVCASRPVRRRLSKLSKNSGSSGCPIRFAGVGQELVARDPTIGRIFDHRADRITQDIAQRTHGLGHEAFAEEIFDLADRRDDRGAISSAAVAGGELILLGDSFRASADPSSCS